MRNLIKATTRTEVSSMFYQIRILIHFMPIFILRKTLSGNIWALSHWTRVYCGSVCVHAVVCTCVYLCAHPYGFTLKHKFFIAFKLPPYFYIAFILISLFSLSERPAMTVGKFSKNLLLPCFSMYSIKMMVSHRIHIFCLLIWIC